MKKKRAHTHSLTHAHTQVQATRSRKANSGKSKNQAARPQQLQRSTDAERRSAGECCLAIISRSIVGRRSVSERSGVGEGCSQHVQAINATCNVGRQCTGFRHPMSIANGRGRAMVCDARVGGQ